MTRPIQLPALIGASSSSRDSASPGEKRARGARATAADAHLAGQGDRRRGLKGGAALLAEARRTYLSTQWSGGDDRRLPKGLIRRVSI